MSTPLLVKNDYEPAIAYPYARPLRIALIVVSLAACALIPAIIIMKTIKVDTEPGSYFVYHPALMSIGVVGIPLAAILQLRLFGYKSKKIHMFSMLLSLKLVLAGAGVIFAIKSSKNEPHYKSTHSILGLIWIVFATCQCIAGLLALDPDTRLKAFKPEQGEANVNRYIQTRRIHAISGILLLGFGYTCVYLGWVQIAESDKMRLPLIAALFVLFCVALVDPVTNFFRRMTSRRDADVADIIEVSGNSKQDNDE